MQQQMAMGNSNKISGLGRTVGECHTACKSNLGLSYNTLSPSAQNYIPKVLELPSNLFFKKKLHNCNELLMNYTFQGIADELNIN